MTGDTRRLYVNDDDLTPAQVIARLKDASSAAGKAHNALMRREHPDDRENLAILLDDFMMLMADASGRLRALYELVADAHADRLARLRAEAAR